MREIKFRAWYIKPKEMSKPFDLDRVASHGLAQNFKRTAILMQFTGLKDKNGKEIYEGDIIKWYGVNGGIPGGKISGIGQVIWNNDDACFIFDHNTLVDDANSFNDQFIEKEEFELIGNIYEHPELLKKVEEGE